MTSGGTLVGDARISTADQELALQHDASNAAGLLAARAHGRGLGGRRPVMTPAKATAARSLIDGKSAVAEVARAVGGSRATPYRHLAAAAA